MITLHPISAGSGVDYLLGSVAHGDVDAHSNGQSLSSYLSEHGDAPGRWGGRGAGTLGLAGEVTDEAADAIFKHGADPRTGELLGRAWPWYPTAQDRYERMLRAEPQASAQRRAELWAKASKAGNRSAKSGWEMVLSPVKSFSVAWGLADDARRARLEAAEERAFTAVFARLEAELAWTRIGTGGAAQLPADGLIGAVFVHRSSRAGDPTYHRHLALSARVPVRESVVDQHTGQTRQRTRWLSLDATPLHAMTVTLGEYYTAELERQMAALGYLAEPRTEVERVGKRPVREFAGVPDQAIAHFSARRTQTTKEYAKFLADFTAREGRAPTRAEQYRLFQAAALKNRPEKKAHVGAAEERARWRTSAAAQGGIARPQRLAEQMAEASAALGVRVEDDWRAQLPTRVLSALAESRATWRRSNIEAEVTRQLVAAGAHLTESGPLTALIGQTVAAVLGDGGTVPLTPPEPVPSPAGYRRADGESVFRAANSAVFTAQALLDAEARLTIAATRMAGGRTLPAATVDAALAHGDAASAEQHIVARAVFGADRRVGAVLGRAGSGKTTVMRLVREVAAAHGIPVLGLSTGQVQADHLAREAGIRAENIARWLHMSEQVHPGDPDWTLALGTLVIVDEAGQASTLDLDALLTQVEAAGGRLLLVGDPLQTGSVQAGGLLADLEAAGAVLATLGGVARFRDHDGALREWESAASLALAHGQAEQSYAAYERHGRIRAGLAEEMTQAAYKAYVRDSGHGLASLLITPDNLTAAALSGRVREARIRAGLVRTGRTLVLSDQNEAAIGDVVATRRNDRRITTRGGRGYVRNGDTWVVQQVHRDGQLTVRDQISGAVATLPADYATEHVTLAYAVTQHRAQGLTVDTAHALVNATMTRNGLYPALTRGRYANTAYLQLTEPLDAESGAPGRATTARHVWTSVVEHDGTAYSATALMRVEHDQAHALAGFYTRLRHVLADLGDARCREMAAAALGPQLAEQVTTAPAWPALAELVRILEAEGGDPAAILAEAYARRSLAGALDDAAVLHARIANTPRYAAAATRHVLADTRVAGPGILRLLGVTPPPETVAGDAARFARDLAAAALARIEQVTADAQHAAWAVRLYGDVPGDPDAAAVRTARIQAAAIYRDLTGRRDLADTLGPVPAPGQYGLRVLWRRAQPAVDAELLRAEALTAAAAGEAWARLLGPIPTDTRLYAGWIAAAAAVLDYRRRWDIGHETLLLGHRVADRVQGADYTAALHQVDRYRAEVAGAPPDAVLPLLPADPAADRAHAALYHAERTAECTAQQAADLRNRLATANAADIEARPNTAVLAGLHAELAAADAAADRAAAQLTAARQAAASVRIAARAANQAFRDRATTEAARQTDSPPRKPEPVQLPPAASHRLPASQHSHVTQSRHGHGR